MNLTSSKENLALKLAKDGIEIEVPKPLYIDYVHVDDIYPNDYNPNTHDPDSFDLLIKSLLYFGFTMPIVVNRRDNRIVDGENRYRAACIIGYELVPVCYVDFDEEKLKYATIMHNAARGHDNKQMMDRLVNYLERNFDSSPDKVLLNNRHKKK